MFYTRDDYKVLYNEKDEPESWAEKITVAVVFIGAVVAVALVFLNMEKTAPTPPVSKVSTKLSAYEENPVPLSFPLPYTATVEYVDPKSGKPRVRYYVPKETK